MRWGTDGAACIRQERPDGSRSSGSAPGNWAPTGATSTKRTPSRCSTPPPTPGVTFFDTADVYGDGRSEQLIGRFLKERPDAGILVATKMGRRVDARPGPLHPRQLPRLDRPLPRQPRRRPARPGAAALPAHRGLRLRRGLRRPRRPRRGRADRRIRRERGDLRRGHDRDRPTGHRQRPDHPEPLPAQAPRTGPARRRSRRGRHHRPRPARLRPALRQVHQGHGLRRERPPHLQPPRRVLRPGRDLLRRRLRHRAWTPPSSSPISRPKARRPPRPRCAGSSSSGVSPASSPVPGPPSRPGRTPRPPISRRCRKRPSRPCATSTTLGFARQVHHRW